MRRVITSGLRLLLLGAWLAGSAPAWGQAEPPAKTDPLELNPATGCMEVDFAPDLPAAERLVPAAAVLESLRGGHCVRIRGAVVQGDLDLTALPVNGVDAQGEPLITLPKAFVLNQTRLEGRLDAARQPQGPRVRFQGPWVLRESAVATVTLAGARFDRGMDLSGTAFAGELRLEGAQVGEELVGQGARFAEAVVLSNLKVEGVLQLQGARFAGPVRAFGLQAGEVVLDGAQFEGPADLAGWRGDSLSAAGTTFAGAANLGRGRWSGPVSWRGASFQAHADLSEGLYAASVDFSGARFQGPARWVGTRFLGWADFAGTAFEEVDFTRAVFLHAPRWTEATFAGPLRLTEVQSAAPWSLSPEQLAHVADPERYDFLPHRPSFDPLPWLAGLSAAAGVVALLLLWQRG